LNKRAVVLNFLLGEKKSAVSKKKKKSSTSVFNIDDKCFLSSRSAYYNDFCRIMWHWRLK